VVGASPVANRDGWYREALHVADVVVACDAAGEWCIGLGRVPDLAVGDFDSAAAGAAERLRTHGVEVVEFPIRKDASDLDLATGIAVARGATAVAVTAAFTNRLDHTLAALGLALRVPASVLLAFRDPGFEARVVRAPAETHLEIEVRPGAVISVVALTPADGVTLAGLEYQLENASLEAFSSLGISNIARGASVTLDAARGTLLVMSVDESVHGIQERGKACR